MSNLEGERSAHNLSFMIRHSWFDILPFSFSHF